MRKEIRNKEGLEIGEGNWKFRRDNKIQGTLYEVYGEDVWDKSSEEIGFREKVYLGIQTKSGD